MATTMLSKVDHFYAHLPIVTVFAQVQGDKSSQTPQRATLVFELLRTVGARNYNLKLASISDDYAPRQCNDR